MKLFLPAGLACLVLAASSCSPKQERLWDGDRAALLNESLAEVLAARLRADFPAGGTLLVIKHPRSEIGGDEASEARFQALNKTLKGSGFVLKTGGTDVPNRKREEKDAAFVNIAMMGFWTTIAEWAAREGQPAAVILLQTMSPTPTAAEAAAVPPIYGTVAVPDPVYNTLVTAGEAKMLLLQQRNGPAMIAAEKDFEKKTARERVALFYEVLE
jgi:hypothetical protein